MATGLLKHPDGQKQLEVISNSISIDYIVHHWLGMLHKPPVLLQIPFKYPFEAVNHIHVTFQLNFKTAKKKKKNFISSWEKEEIKRKDRKILTRWSGQDYPLNMASQSL